MWNIQKINLTLLIAIWGAILSTILAVLEIIKFRRDRVNMKVSVKGGYQVIPGNHPLNPYGNRFLVSITAVNKGTRPVTLNQAGLLLPRGSRMKYLVSVESVTSVELTEGRSRDYHILEEEVHGRGLSPNQYVAYVKDATGKLFWSHNFLARFLKLHRIR